MARLYKRGRYWWYQFRGERYSTRCTDRKAAEAAARDIERRVTDPTYRPAHETTLGACLTAWVEDRRRAGRAAGTLRAIGVHVAHLARILGEETPIARIGAAEIETFTAKRHAEGASRSTQGKERSTLHGALGRARRLRLYPFALDEVFGPFEVEYEPVKRRLTERELPKLLAELPADRAAVCAFIVATSADHPTSVARVERGDIDLKRWRVLVKGTKNKYRHRVVAVVLPLFRRLLKLAATHVPFRPWTNAVRDLKAACARAKVPRVTPRDLRRTHGYILHARGVAPDLIAPGMGHADSTMVETIYGKLETGNVEVLLRQSLTPRKTGTARARSGATKRKSAGKKAR